MDVGNAGCDVGNCLRGAAKTLLKQDHPFVSLGSSRTSPMTENSDKHLPD